MSSYQGGIITKNSITPTGPNYNGAASGVWTMDQAAYWQRQGLWPTQGVGVPDPSFPYVTMLLSTTSLNGGQNGTFLDTSTNNFTFTNVNTPTQGSFSPYGANWSGYFDGSGDYLNTAASSSLGLTGDWTVEGWVYQTSTAGAQVFLDTRGSGATGFGIYCSLTGYAGGPGAIGYANNAALVATSSTAIPLNTWTHLAFTRSGNTVTGYINGVSAFTYTESRTLSSTMSYFIGADYLAGSNAYGYFSNLRVVRGTAVYTGNFTPPTAPLTAITNTSLLTCAYNRFRDGSTNNFTITVNGNSKTTDFSPFSPAYPGYTTTANGGSLLFNGSNEATYVDSSNAALTLGTGDFTIELWVYQLVLGGAQSWVSTYGGPSAGYRFSPTNTMQFSWGDTGIISTAVNTDVNQWSHVAVTRSGTTIRMFKNGVVIATGTDSTNLTGGSTQTTLGRIPTYNQWYYNGYMSDVRIVKGTAVYTADYTPPTAPLTAISGTSLLAAGTNANIFDAAAMNDMTTVGNAQVSTAVSKFGGSSMYFDGTGDYLTSNALSDLYAFGTGDFTIEMWFNLSSFASLQILYDSRPTSTDGLYPLIYVASGGGSVIWQISAVARITGTATLSTGVWYHVAVSRSSGSTKMFLNGTQIGSTYADTNAYLNSGTTRPFIGGSSYTAGTLTVNGYIDDLRITKGVARYTTTFTPPTQAFLPY